MNKKISRKMPKYVEYLAALFITVLVVTIGPVIVIYLLSLLVGLGMDAIPFWFLLVVFGGWLVSKMDKLRAYKRYPFRRSK